MRAVVFLCLLNLALSMAQQMGWNGPVIGTTPFSEGSACLQDQGSCGCCKMVQEVNRLRTFFNKTISRLEKEYEDTVQSFNNVESSRTAMSVALNNDGRFSCVGPYSLNTVIKYQHIFLNLGNGYNVNTGIFTVPRSGVYTITLTIFSDAGAAGNILAACAGLMINRNMMVGSKDINRNDQEDSSTIAIVMVLEANDKVSVLLPPGCFLCDDNNHYNTFSIFLLYPTE